MCVVFVLCVVSVLRVSVSMHESIEDLGKDIRVLDRLRSLERTSVSLAFL